VSVTELSSLLYKLKTTDQKVTQLFENKLSISLTRYEILQRLLELAPCSQVALQESLQIDQAAITRHLKILEEEGYISRHRNPQNQRQLIVNLRGKALHDLQDQPSEQHLSVKQQMQDIFTDEESETLSNLLDKLINGLENITF
jgi:DNA-binding MarR family transcriptional regulator